jgi:hypothetical protein
MSEDKVRRVLLEALRVWSEVTPLTFTEVSSGKADIVIDFTRYACVYIMCIQMSDFKLLLSQRFPDMDLYCSYWHGDNLP